MYGATLLNFEAILFSATHVKYFLSQKVWFGYTVDRDSVDMKEIIFGAQMSMTMRHISISHINIPANRVKS
jgi:hypothetical protein